MSKKDHFDKAFNFLLGIEGTFSNDPDDRGGPTNWGITIDDLSRWRKKAVALKDVKSLSKEEAKKIYRAFYWNKLNLDEVREEIVAIAIFDQAVNRGAVTVAKQVQNLLGVEDDGKIGPITLGKINESDPIDFVFRFVKASQVSYGRIIQSKPELVKFLVGWLNRTHRILDLLYERS